MSGSWVGFSGTADLMALFPVRTNPRWRQDGGHRHLGNISNGHISATGFPIHFMFCSTLGFSGTADVMALFLPTTFTASLLDFGDNITSHHLMRKTLKLDFLWEGSLRYVSYTVSRQEIKLQLLSGTI